MSPYEVRCHTCDVSFPPGTKRCLHCGGKTVKPGRGRPQPREAEIPIFSEEVAARPEEEAGAADESAGSRRGPGPGRVLVAGMWVLIAVFASIYRVCSG